MAAPVLGQPAPPPAQRADQLIARARAKDLANSRQWRRLGHWRSRWLRSAKSEADSRAFFLAEDGKTDPSAELEATIRALLSPPTDEDHPVCRYPARQLFLQRTVGFDPAWTAGHRCPKRDRFVASIEADSAALVFSSYFMGRAASAFGHTLLRLGKRGSGEAPRPELLDTGINFSASVDTSNSIVYAFKGLTGLFRGEFRRMPFYYKVREYTDHDTRDLWTYELAMTRDEVDMLVAHVWELGHTYFAYYYTSENCSYHLLGALEAAMPRVELLRHVKWPVIPSDTIKALFHTPGLVKTVKYRPSLRTQFERRVRALPADQRQWVTTLAEAPEAAVPPALGPEALAPVIDAAIDLIDLEHADDILADPASEPGLRKFALLGRRAELGLQSSDPAGTVSFEQSPHESHGSARLSLGSGLDDGERPFLSLRGRLALHDLADPPRGYPELSQIEFLPTELRYRPGEQLVTLESMQLVRVVNLAPLDQFTTPMSWAFEIGGQRLDDDGCPDCFAGNLEVSAGSTLATANQAAAVWLLTGGRVAYHPDLSGLGPVRLGPIGALGARVRLGTDTVAVAQSSIAWLPGQDPAVVWDAELVVRWSYFHNQALELSTRAFPNTLETAANWSIYY